MCISSETRSTICRAADDCLQELRWIYDRRELAEARRDIAAWLAKWQVKHSRLCDWVEENIEETLTYYRLPQQHHKHMKSTNMLERLNQELKRRTHVVRIFPNAESCLRLVRAGRRDPRELARRPPLLGHAALGRAQEGGAAAGGMIARQPGPLWRRARRRQDQAACGGGPPFGRVSLDRGCARRPLNPGRDGETVLRSNKETGTLSTPDRPSGPIANRDVTIDHRR